MQATIRATFSLLSSLGFGGRAVRKPKPMLVQYFEVPSAEVLSGV
jgi:hypothetical protein